MTTASSRESRVGLKHIRNRDQRGAALSSFNMMCCICKVAQSLPPSTVENLRGALPSLIFFFGQLRSTARHHVKR